MEPVSLMLFALVYIALQASVILRFEGRWLSAAILPVPILCLLLVASVVAGSWKHNGPAL